MPTPEQRQTLGSDLGSPSRCDGPIAAIMAEVELDWLETFLAVVDRGGFTAASGQVHRSQSRVSAHIASLEREIGVRLIDRGRRPATVTEAGRVFATHAREILADLRTARSAVAALRALSDQSLLVHTTPGIGATLFPRVLTDVLARFPAATVTLAERDWSADAAGVPHEAVLVVAPADRPSSPAARRQILWWEPLRLVVPDDHDLARTGAPVSPCRLAEQRLLVSSTAGRVLAAITDAPADSGGPGRPRVTVDAPQTLASLVRSSSAVDDAPTTPRPNPDRPDRHALRHRWCGNRSGLRGGGRLVRRVVGEPGRPGPAGGGADRPGTGRRSGPPALMARRVVAGAAPMVAVR